MKKIALVFGAILLLANIAIAQVAWIPIEDLIDTYTSPIICGMYYAFVWIGGGLASLMLIYAGLKYLMSSDDPAGRKTAKDMIMHAVIAIIIIVTAMIIVGLISGGELVGC